VRLGKQGKNITDGCTIRNRNFRVINLILSDLELKSCILESEEPGFLNCQVAKLILGAKLDLAAVLGGESCAKR
jgi:hypothetical protein